MIKNIVALLLVAVLFFMHQPLQIVAGNKTEQTETLSMNTHGDLYYGNDLLYANGVPANINVLKQTNNETVLQTSDPRQSVYIEFHGVLTYSGSSVGNFTIDGKQAFCLEHAKSSPPNGTPNNGQAPYNDDHIKRILYYGWDGPKNIFGVDKTRGIVVTSLVLSKYYSGNTSGTWIDGYAELDQLAVIGEVPYPNGQATDTNLEVFVRNDKQISESTTIVAWSGNEFLIGLPYGITLVNETTGEYVHGSGNAIVHGGDTIHLEAGIDFEYDWTSNDIHGSVLDFQPLIIKPHDSNLQTIANWRWYDDPTNYFTLTAQFEAQDGWLEVEKRDSVSHLPLASAMYDVYDQNGNWLESLVTDESGRAVSKALAPNEMYTVVETMAPYGYTINETPQTVFIQSNKITPVTFDNNAVHGVISIGKTGQMLDGATTEATEYGDLFHFTYAPHVLAGAEFTITAKENITTPDGVVHYKAGELVDTVKTHEDGVGASKNLPLGIYEVKEVSAPYGYIMDEITHVVELTYENEHVQLVSTEIGIENERQQVQFQIVKTKEMTTGEMVPSGPGFVFGLYAAEDIRNAVGDVVAPKHSLISIMETDELGIAKSKTDLPVGSVYAKEIAAPSSYLLSTDMYSGEFRPTNNDSDVQIRTLNNGYAVENRLNKAPIEVVKKIEIFDSFTENGEPVMTHDTSDITDGIQFAILDEQQQEIDRLTIDNGRAKSSDLPYGNYTLVEDVKTVPDNYNTHPPIRFEINEQTSNEEKPIQIEVVNTLKDTPVPTGELPDTGESFHSYMMFYILAAFLGIVGIILIVVSLCGERRSKR